MANRKYIVGGKVYEETTSRKVIVGGKVLEETAAAGRIMSSLASHGGLAGKGGIAGQGGGLAG